MPLYEYECLDCGERFEALVRRNSSAPACSSCQSGNLKQLISMFAVDSDGVRQSNLKAARQKSAKIQKDKAIADHESMHDHH